MAVTRTAAKPATRSADVLQVFLWEGKDKRGVKMKGEQPAKNESFVRAELRRQGITPTVVKQKKKPLFGSAGSKIKGKDIAVFSRQIATMLRSGVPIVSSLEIISSGHKNPKMAAMVGSLKRDIEGGSSLSESL